MIRLSRRLSCFRTGIVLSFLCIAGPVAAKLPPPTPELAAAAQAAKDKAAADAAAEQALLAKVQDRMAAAYIARQRANGITVTPTPITPPPALQASSPAGTGAAVEVPSAALQSRPTEKAGAHSEAVTPSSAQPASSGTKTESAPPVPQTK